ncbi:diguanylate cyclase domain-containing protein [Neptunomonas antarctica]|uniref:PAS domain S-box-containing protein/diguanylate cyclase (GGDEF) domain-containing protein n=1 Tax=Neptunomonas antarctica TaxID=619304 RepID=A0A1N7P8K2_9GAMM|nr:diguanylate cyclase [Neptunomonas antarctica]SIT06924.1 PAS domain S-box-containing protein/diguanylate cyclase (GGDEF) domain-containing protein [Neptunomonas antarctica]
MTVKKGQERRPINPVHIIVLSLVILLTATLLSMMAVIDYGVDQVNDEARSSSEVFTESVVRDKLNQLETTAADYAFWDETIKHAYHSQDREWIDANLGQYLTGAFGINDLIILGSQNNPVLSINDGFIVDPLFYSKLADDLKYLSAKARESAPVSAGVSSISLINGTPVLLSAAILASESGILLPSPAPVLIIGTRLNHDYLLALAKLLHVNSLLFNTNSRHSLNNALSFIKLKDINNNILGELSWEAAKPGDQVLMKIKTPVLFLLIGCGITLLLIIRASRTITKRLTDAKERVYLLSSAIDQSKSIVLIFNNTGELKYANSQALHFFSASLDGKNITDIFPTTLNEKFHYILNTHIKNTGRWSGEFEFKATDKHSVWMHASLSPVIEKDSPVHTICVLEDISTMKNAFDKMTHLATHDVLTDLINRRLFNEFLQQAIYSSKRDNESSALLYIDLDGFKKVNDSLGHITGDELLVEVAARLHDSTREADIVARIGGDEFAILLKNLSHRTDINIILQKILTSLGKPMMLSNNEVNITASIGVAMIPTDGIDIDTLMCNADLALYESKSIGKATFQFYADIANLSKQQ